jgi:hypothetical protein
VTILFVAPSMFSTGEAMTALVCAERLRAVGHTVHFLCSPFIGDRLPPTMPYHVLTIDRATNIAMWYGLLADIQPNAIIFADFEKNFFEHERYGFGDAAWGAALDTIDAELMTFDHIGLLQRPGVLKYGRAPYQLIESVPALPRQMVRLLPCPIHEPGDVHGRDGIPFRYWTPYSISTDDIIETRKSLAPEGLLVTHFVPAWTERVARMLERPYYEELSAFFQRVFTGLDQPVTIVSVNESGLLLPSLTKDVRIANHLAPSYNFVERLIHGDPFKALLFESGVLVSSAKLLQHHFFDSGGIIPTI